MQAKLRKLNKRHHSNVSSGSEDSDDETSGSAARKKRPANGPSALDEMLAKYASGRKAARKGKKNDEKYMNMVDAFRLKVKAASSDQDALDQQQERERKDAEQQETEAKEAEEEQRRLDDDTGGLEVDDDLGFMSHALKALRDADAGEQTRRAESDYTVSEIQDQDL